jgi:bifunctional non-homologous end joining protein LigD
MAADKAGGKSAVEVDGHRIALTNLGKVLYPDTGTTKAEVMEYYAAVSPVMIPHLADRPVTRKRWPDGVAAQPFFEKNLGHGVPAWVRRRALEHSDRTAQYPLVGSVADLVWLGQVAALELHVPQWVFDDQGERSNPDRLVFDLDPGPGITLADCAMVARTVRDALGSHGSALVPVTSGSKGLHLYLGLNGSMTSDEASAWAHALARAVERSMPDLVVSRMTKSLRTERVLIDWSQNNGNKTTIAPYSLRGKDVPMVAAPRTWDELEDPALAHLDYRQVLDRIDDMGDPMADLGRPVGRSLRTLRGTARRAAVAIREAADAAGVESAFDGPDPLAKYRSMRSADRTPEPVPEAGPVPRGNDDTFVIQEHHARRLHWDFRLERDGVLVSWAVPRGLPTDTRQNRLAVHTEDHPLEYATFAGTIPKGEYGGGEVTIWDAGTYRTEKWRDDEVIVVLYGERARGRYVLVRTEGSNWLMHLMKDQCGIDGESGGDGAAGADRSSSDGAAGADRTSGDGDAGADRTSGDGDAGSAGGDGTSRGARRSRGAPLPRDLAPMLASPGTLGRLGDGVWRMEAKWDGIRAIVELDRGALAAHSRAGNDLTAGYPELAELAEMLREHAVVLDGEIVALAENGAPSFSLLQQRMGLSKPRDVRAAAARVPVEYYAFDVLFLDGISLLDKSYDDRRRILQALHIDGEHCTVPPQLAGSPGDALDESRRRKLEGIVAKRADSTYQPGRRSGAWIKVKHWATQDVVVVGWKPGAGRREGGIGSLLLAIPNGDGSGTGAGALAYAGKVGTGFTDAMLDQLRAKLQPLRRKTSPVAGTVPAVDARDAVWVTPSLVGEVTYSEITRDGRLRQPAWRGLREDVPVDQVRREA